MTEQRSAAATPSEEALLCTFCVNEARIRSGHLYKNERAWLEEIRFLKKSILEKYPSFSFQWLSFSPRFGIKQYAELLFSLEGEEERFTAHLISPDQIIDNFYGFLLRPELENRLSALFPDAAVFVFVPTLAGSAYSEIISLQYLRENKLSVFPQCRLVFPMEALSEDLLSNCKSILQQDGLTGFFQIQIMYPKNPKNPLYVGSFSISA